MIGTIGKVTGKQSAGRLTANRLPRHAEGTRSTPGSRPPGTEKAMNYYLTSQLVAERQTALAADVAYRARLKDARAARKARLAAANRPARTRRLFLGRPAHAAV